jgi:hypothetical protein
MEGRRPARQSFGFLVYTRNLVLIGRRAGAGTPSPGADLPG